MGAKFLEIALEISARCSSGWLCSGKDTPPPFEPHTRPRACCGRRTKPISIQIVYLCQSNAIRVRQWPSALATGLPATINARATQNFNRMNEPASIMAVDQKRSALASSKASGHSYTSMICQLAGFSRKIATINTRLLPLFTSTSGLRRFTNPDRTLPPTLRRQ